MQAIICSLLKMVVTAIFALGIIPCASLANPLLELKLLNPIEITYLQQIHLNVASDAVNRISFDNFLVTKLIGNIDSFNSILSEQGNDLFIAPKLPAGKRIDFSALLASGDIIDFSLNIIKSETPTLVKLKFPSSSGRTHKSEAVKMIEAMKAGKVGKYYVRQSSNKINFALIPEIKAVAGNSYRFKSLHGTSLLLENMNRSRSIELTASNLNLSFDSVAAISIDNQPLPPKGKTKAFVVFKGGDLE